MENKISTIIISLICLIGLYYIFAEIVPFSVVIKSMDKIEFESSSQWWDGETWVITLSQSTMGQSIIGITDPEEMQERSGAPIRPERNLEIKILNPKQTCEWTALSDRVLYNYHYHYWSCYWYDEEYAKRHCSGSGKVYLGGGKQPYSFDCICMWKSAEGWIGELTDEKIRTKSQIELISGEKRKTIDIDTKGNSEGWIDDIGYYKYNGDLLLSSCRENKPSMNYYIPIYKNGVWYLTKASNYNSYINDINDFENYYQNLLEGSSWTVEEFKNKINNINRDVDNLHPISTNGYFKGNTYLMDLKSSITNPEYTFWIKASWLGIYQPIPNIKIEKVECEDIGSSGKGVCEVHLKNYGETGGGTLTLEIPSPFVGDSKSVYLNKNEYKIYDLTVTGYSNTEISRTGEICIQNSGGEKYCQNVDIKFTPQILCQPEGATQCADSKTIEKCFNKYIGWEFYKRCGEDERCEIDNYGFAKCVKIGGIKYCGDGFCEGIENCENCPSDCQCPNGYICDRGQCFKKVEEIPFDIDTMILILTGILGVGTSTLIIKKAVLKNRLKNKN